LFLYKYNFEGTVGVTKWQLKKFNMS
jgi:hypothetical protein